MDRSTIELIVFIVYLACMLGIGVFFFDKVRIVGANNFCVGFSCQFDQYRIDFLLPHIYFLVAAGFVGFVSL